MAIDEFDDVTGELLPAHFIGDEEFPFIRSPYNYDRDAVSFDTGLACDDLSLTKQSEANDADINEIVRRFGLTGQLPQGVRTPSYGDFVGVSDYRAALAAIQQADDDFMELPADLRARFQNDPQQYADFVLDPANKEQLYDLGLAERPRQAPLPSTDASTGSPVAASATPEAPASA